MSEQTTERERMLSVLVEAYFPLVCDLTERLDDEVRPWYEDMMRPLRDALIAASFGDVSERDRLIEERDAALAVIDAAPHEPDCAIWEARIQGVDNCDCWKSRVNLDALHKRIRTERADALRQAADDFEGSFSHYSDGSEGHYLQRHSQLHVQRRLRARARAEQEGATDE